MAGFFKHRREKIKTLLSGQNNTYYKPDLELVLTS